MKVLTDTHTLVWALSEPETLGKKERAALSESPFTASVVNLWELILKKGRGNAPVADPLPCGIPGAHAQHKTAVCSHTAAPP